jgi:type II secretory pathway pseudopilin PulG
LKPKRTLKKIREMRATGGVTLVEVLIAAVIAALLLTSLAAFFAVSTIKRYQSLKIVQATNLAESQINEVREFWQSFDDQGVSYFDRQDLVFAWSDDYLPKVPSTSNYPTKDLKDPAAIAPDSNRIPLKQRAIPIDADGDGTTDFLAQVFVGAVPGTSGTLKRLVVRIFDKNAVLATLDKTPVLALRPLVYGDGAMVNAQGTEAPLVVLVADLTRPEQPL